MNIILVSMQENLCAFGIRYIFYEVRKAGYDATLVYPNLLSEIADGSGYSGFIDRFSSFLQENGADIVGVSFMSYQSGLVRRMCKDIKKILPNVIFVGGGIHVTAFPEKSLEFFDAVCLGEGEISFIGLLNEYAQKRSLVDIDVPGMMTAASRNNRHAPTLLRDLDMLAMLPIVDEPSFFYKAGQFHPIRITDIGRFQRYNGNAYDIMTSRGCPLECTYCANNVNTKLYGRDWKKIRLRSVDHVIGELARAVSARPMICFVNFQDDSFTSRPLSWFKDFVPRYLREIKLPLMFRMIPGSIDDEKSRLISSLPVIAAGIGLQSGSRRILNDLYRRPVNVDTFINTVQRLHSHKIMPVVDVILDNPYEERRDILETIKALISLPKPFLLELYGFRFYPGTEIASRALAEGVIKECDTYKTQTTIESDDEKRFLNNTIFITAHYPRVFIRFLVRQENRRAVRVVMPLLVMAGSIINAGYFLFMIMRSHKYNPLRFFRFLYLTIDPTVTVLHVFPFFRGMTMRRKKREALTAGQA